MENGVEILSKAEKKYLNWRNEGRNAGNVKAQKKLLKKMLKELKSFISRKVVDVGEKAIIQLAVLYSMKEWLTAMDRVGEKMFGNEYENLASEKKKTMQQSQKRSDLTLQRVGDFSSIYDDKDGL